jgi:hypothetical protein
MIDESSRADLSTLLSKCFEGMIEAFKVNVHVLLKGGGNRPMKIQGRHVSSHGNSGVLLEFHSC